MARRLLSTGSLPGLLTAAALLLVWQLASLTQPAFMLPGLDETWERIVGVITSEPGREAMGTTLWRVLAGLAASMLIGTAIGMAMGLQRQIESFAASWVVVMLTFPAIAWAFLGVMWFGLSTWVPVLAVVAIVVPFVTLNAWSGTKALDKELLDMSRAFGASWGLRIRKVILPQLMPFFFSSLRIAFAVSWKIVLIAEAFGIRTGVGRAMKDWFADLRADMVLAWALAFMAIMVLIEFGIFRWWERGVFRWRHHVAT